MLRIRLKQTGKKDAKKYRIVVIDSKNKREGKEIKILGHYDPMPNPSIMQIDVKNAEEWIAKGAIMSERVSKIFTLAKENKIK